MFLISSFVSILQKLLFSCLFECHYLPGSHFVGKSILAGFPNPTDAGFPVRLEDKSENFAEEIVEFRAIVWIHSACSTCGESVVHAAGAYFAPLGTVVFTATGAFALDVLAAGTAVESAIGYQFFSHKFCERFSSISQINEKYFIL